MPPSAHKGHGSEGYGSRAEVFLTGFGLVGSRANGNAITEEQTDAGGVAVGYRFHLNASSALEGRYGFSRNSDKYTIGGVVSSIPSYFSDISGSYVYTFSKLQHIRPFLEGGGGVVLFIPGNYNTPTTSTTGGATSGTPSGFLSGYALATTSAQAVVGPVYSGSSAGIGTQARGHVSVWRRSGDTRIFAPLLQDRVPGLGVRSAGFQTERAAYQRVHLYVRTRFQHCLSLLVPPMGAAPVRAPALHLFSGQSQPTARRVALKLSSFSNGEFGNL